MEEIAFMQPANRPHTVTLDAVGDRTNALLGALSAVALGLFILWGVGFSSLEIMHNAAHDTRHSNVFPCH